MPKRQQLSASLLGAGGVDIEMAATVTPGGHMLVGTSATEKACFPLEDDAADVARHIEIRRHPMQADRLWVGIHEAPMGDVLPAGGADASGDGPIGAPRSAHVAGVPAQVVLEDRGVRGAILSFRSGGAAQQIELPLAFAKIECEGAALTVTVHKDVHPDCKLGGKPISLTCPSTGGATEMESWKCEIDHAIEKLNGKHWGISRSFIGEQKTRWAAEGERCKGMTVAEYFVELGLGHVYDDTWGWCAGALADVEAQAEKSAADLKNIAYFKRKIEKTEAYEDMELTDYMNVLKHHDLVPARRKVSYADFIHAESDSFGRRKVGAATVFVSHVWKMTAKDFFEVCLAEMAEEDYAWIDLYLHNQYQGAVSDIGDENSEYWVKKFGELIGGIGKVIAIVTDWESPVMLTRIWCLFELNAAIDTGAELRFVATAAQRMDLMLNLNKKFKYLDAIVQSIEVRDCDAKRPHEIQDKKIFLGKLRGVENEVNKKLRTEMQRWLAASADGVLWRTDPYREPMGAAELLLEVAAIGKGSGVFCCVSGAKRTRLLEDWPRLPTVLMVSATTALLSGAVLIFKLIVILNSRGSRDRQDQAYFCLLIAVGCLIVVFPVSASLAAGLQAHQNARQLRRPPAVGAFLRLQRRVVVATVAWVLGTVVFALVLRFWVGLQWSQGDRRQLGAVEVGLVMALFVTLMGVWALRQDTEAAATRAQLATNVGWLRLRLGEAEVAEKIFRAAHEDLQHMIGAHHAECSYIATPGLARCLCELHRAKEAEELANVVEMGVRRHVGNRCSQRIGVTLVDNATAVTAGARAYEWRQHGPLLRARMAAAARAPDASVLRLLTEAGQTNLGEQHALDETEPEWAELLARMASDRGKGNAEDRATWDELPPLMRSSGNNALSPWVKYTHKGRSYYKRDNPMETTLVAPQKGVRQEAEIGMPGLVMLGESAWEKLPGMTWGADRWESEYADLGGPGCWTSQQNLKYKRIVTKKKTAWRLLLASILLALFCQGFLYVDCGEQGQWGFGSCRCTSTFVGYRCQHDCDCGPHGIQLDIAGARATGSCGDGRCACTDNFAGDYCEASCGDHGVSHNNTASWEGNTCDCVGSFVGDHCGSECHCGGTTVNNATTVGSCGGVSCATCKDGFVGEFCQLAFAYVISGATDDDCNGRYLRLGEQCNGKPVYQRGGSEGTVLFQSLEFEDEDPIWYVVPRSEFDRYEGGISRVFTGCDTGDWAAQISSDGTDASCPESPDGDGCQGRWQELVDDVWQDSSLVVAKG